MKFAKLLVGVGFIVSLASLGGNWYLYERYAVEKINAQKLETSLVQLGEENSFLKHQVEQAEKFKDEVERLRDQLKDYVDQRDNLKKEVDSAYEKASELQKQILKLQLEKKELKNELNRAKATNTAVVQETTRLPEVPNPAIPAPVVPSSAPTIPVAPAVPSPKVAAIKAFSGAPEAKEKKEAPTPEKPAAPPASAKKVEDARPQQVLTVNRQFNFVVVNLGLRNKVKIGDILRVEQGGKLIAKVQVEKLYDNFSACAIMEEIKPGQIHEGDLVRLV